MFLGMWNLILWASNGVVFLSGVPLAEICQVTLFRSNPTCCRCVTHVSSYQLSFQLDHQPIPLKSVLITSVTLRSKPVCRQCNKGWSAFGKLIQWGIQYFNKLLAVEWSPFQGKYIKWKWSVRLLEWLRAELFASFSMIRCLLSKISFNRSLTMSLLITNVLVVVNFEVRLSLRQWTD